MTSMFLAFVTLIVLRLAWGAWKSTLRDIVRDRLFDLRDEWREFFVKNGLSMELPEYARVRDFLNHYLRYSCRLRLVGLLYTARFAPSRLLADTASKIDEDLYSSNPMVAKEIARIRREAVRAVQEYMVLTSLLLVPLLALALMDIFAHSFKEPLLRAKSSAKRLLDGFDPLSSQSIELAAAA